MSPRTVSVLIRWIIGLTLIATGVSMIVKVSTKGHDGGYAAIMAYSLFAFAIVIMGLISVARDIAAWAAAPIWRFITGIVFPDDKFIHPPVNYALPRGYRQRFRPEDAIPEYLKIIQHHPQELDAYLECIEVMMETGDARGAERVFTKGMRKLRQTEARARLKEHCATLRKRAEAAAG